jgi:hypothetical protein
VGFYFDIYGYKRQFFAAFGAFSLVQMENFVWRAKFRALV